MKVAVEYESITLRNSRSGGQFGSWSSENSFSVTRALAIDSDDCLFNSETFEVPDVKLGDLVHVVYMIYSSGDSFGHGYGYGSIFEVFSDIDEAYRLVEEINNHSNDFEIKFKCKNGEEKRYYNSGSGYFSSVTRVDVSTHKIEKT